MGTSWPQSTNQPQPTQDVGPANTVGLNTLHHSQRHTAATQISNNSKEHTMAKDTTDAPEAEGTATGPDAPAVKGYDHATGTFSA